MRIELEQIEKIERYLLGLFDYKEREQFENQLITNPILALEVEWQQILMNRIEKIALKKEITLAHKKYMHRFRYSIKNQVFRNWVITTSVFVLISVMMIVSTIFNNKTQQKDSGKAVFSPIASNKKAFKETQIFLNKPVILRYGTGTYIIISQDAFVDEQGIGVTGKVNIKFREFNRKQEKFLGVLQSDSSGMEFLSLIEFYAFKNDKPLKIKEGKEIEIIQLTHITSPLYSLFQFETKENHWEESGKDLCFDLSGQVVNNQLLPSLIESLHIENPSQDPVILEEQTAYLEILQKLHVLDSMNNEIGQNYQYLDGKPPGKNEAMKEAFELYRQRLILLTNSDSKILIDSLVAVGLEAQELIKRKSFIVKEYQKFTKTNLKKIRNDLKFCRTYSINSVGFWSIGIPLNR